MKDKKKILGILLKENDVFYYLETDEIQVTNAVDQVRSRLIQKGKKLFQIGQQLLPGENPYEIISLDEAEKRNKVIEVMYLSNRVKETVTTEKKETGTGWLK